MKTQDITNLTLLELKALIYDLLEERALLEQNLVTVKREIQAKLAAKEEGSAGSAVDVGS